MGIKIHSKNTLVVLTSSDKGILQTKSSSASLSSIAMTRHRWSCEGNATSNGGTPVSMLHRGQDLGESTA